MDQRSSRERAKDIGYHSTEETGQDVRYLQVVSECDRKDIEEGYGPARGERVREESGDNESNDICEAVAR